MKLTFLGAAHEVTGSCTYIEVGDKIISSGEGSVYPYGFSIGTVVDKTLNESKRTISAVIEPDVDFDIITRVMLVKRK